MKKSLLTLFLLSLLAVPSLSWGAACGAGPFYVSSGIGSDSNNGTSAATPWAHHPWDSNKTGSANCTLAAGNTVYMRRGDVWYNTYLSAAQAGSSGNQIIMTSVNTFYAVSPSDAYPSLSVASVPLKITWTQDGGNNDWYATVGQQAYVVLFNGVGLAPVTTQLLCQSTANSFYSTASTVYVNVGGSSPSTGTCEVAKQNYVILGGGGYQTFSYLDLRAGNTTAGGVAFNNGYAGVIFDHLTVEGFSNYGLYQYGTSGLAGNQITNCTVTQGTKASVAALYLSNDGAPVVTGNTVTGGGSSFTGDAIKVLTSPNAVISGNTATYYYNGLDISSGSNGFQVFGNTFAYLNSSGILVTTSGLGSIYSNQIHDVSAGTNDNGIWLSSSNGNLVYGNTIYNNTSGYYNTGHGTGIEYSGSSAGNLIYQNNLYNNYIGILIEPTSGTGGNLISYNLVANSTVNGIDCESSGTGYDLVFNDTIIHNPSGLNAAASCTGPGAPGSGCTGSGTGYVGHGMDSQSSCAYIEFANNLVYLMQPGNSSNCQAFAIAGSYTSVFTDYNLLYDATPGGNGYIGQLNGVYYTAAQKASWQAALQADGKIFGMDGTTAHAESHELISNPLLTNVAGGNYTIGSNSPAIGAGTWWNNSISLMTDYAGTTTNYLPPDIGAYWGSRGSYSKLGKGSGSMIVP